MAITDKKHEGLSIGIMVGHKTFIFFSSRVNPCGVVLHTHVLLKMKVCVFSFLEKGRNPVLWIENVKSNFREKFDPVLLWYHLNGNCLRRNKFLLQFLVAPVLINNKKIQFHKIKRNSTFPDWHIQHQVVLFPKQILSLLAIIEHSSSNNNERFISS